MVNRYFGNSGIVQRIPESHGEHQISSNKMQPAPIKKPPPNPSGGGFNHSFQKLLRRVSPANMEQEDLILLLILYLLYRESGDKEFLITLALFLFL